MLYRLLPPLPAPLLPPLPPLASSPCCPLNFPLCAPSCCRPLPCNVPPVAGPARQPSREAASGCPEVEWAPCCRPHHAGASAPRVACLSAVHVISSLSARHGLRAGRRRRRPVSVADALVRGFTTGSDSLCCYLHLPCWSISSEAHRPAGLAGPPAPRNFALRPSSPYARRPAAAHGCPCGNCSRSGGSSRCRLACSGRGGGGGERHLRAALEGRMEQCGSFGAA